MDHILYFNKKTIKLYYNVKINNGKLIKIVFKDNKY